MTSAFMIFEITQDDQILVPLMVANMLSFMISSRYQPVPVYHAVLQQDGVHLPSPGSSPTGPGRTVRHVMRTDVPLFSPHLTVEQASLLSTQRNSASLLVGTRDHLQGVVTFQQREQWRASGKGAQPIGDMIRGSFRS
jgi:CIC family chloride channel protein